MNKQEMAEWLAKNVLGFKVREFDLMWVNGEGNEHLFIESYIYCPDGFFAVWDALHSEIQYIEFTEFQIETCCKLVKKGFSEDVGTVRGYGKDRYEAFYNAVYEAMK